MSKKMNSVLLLMFASILLLSACTNPTKPEDMTQEFWDEAIQIILYVNQKVENKELIDTDIVLTLDADADSFTDKEKEVVEDVRELARKSLPYYLATTLGDSGSEEKKEYNKVLAKLEETFGKSNLKKSDKNEALINEKMNEHEEAKQTEKEDKKIEFMRKHKTTLTGKEVQYDMANNLDTPFYLEGTVEVCDYYNYGYTNEKDYYCGEFTPFDGGYSDSWYLYFHRKSFDAIYEVLLNEGSIDLRIIAEIPSSGYKRGQGNMAGVEHTIGY